MIFFMQIIGGRHLIYKESHSPDPYVVIEILGADFDHAKASTREGSNCNVIWILN